MQAFDFQTNDIILYNPPSLSRGHVDADCCAAGDGAAGPVDPDSASVRPVRTGLRNGPSQPIAIPIDTLSRRVSGRLLAGTVARDTFVEPLRCVAWGLGMRLCHCPKHIPCAAGSQARGGANLHGNGGNSAVGPDAVSPHADVDPIGHTWRQSSGRPLG